MALLSEHDVGELLAFLVTAARTQVDEAPEYGPLRLMTAAARLAEMLGPDASPALRALGERIRSMPPVATPASDPDGYRAELDDLCRAVADYLLAAEPETQ